MEPCILNQVTNAQFEKGMTPEKRAKFWAYAKSIGANAGVPHGEIIAKMADEFNMPHRLVAQALDGPKSLRTASEAVKARQKMSQQFMADNRHYLETLDHTGLQRIHNFINDKSMQLTLKYHGPVPPVTHAIDVAMTNPIEFLKLYGRGFQGITEAGADRIMTNLEYPKVSPYYKIFLDAGAPIGRETVEGFKGTGWASRSMDTALKPWRYKMMEKRWVKAPLEERTPEYARQLAQEYAHASGAILKNEFIEKLTRPIRPYLLARQLTPSRIAKALFDPAETINTYWRMAESKIPGSKTRPATWGERHIAYNRTVRAARWFAPTLLGLYANQKILEYLGSKQKVNWEHASRSDFAAFKFGGKMYRSRGALEILALIAKLGALSPGYYSHVRYGQQLPEEAIAKYSEYKLAPGLGITKEVLSGTDWFGRPAPWSPNPGNRIFPRKNWIEFAGEHSPIFIGHGISTFHETLRDHGVDTRQSMNVLRAVQRNPKAVLDAAKEAGIATGLEFFGINVQPDRYIGR